MKKLNNILFILDCILYFVFIMLLDYSVTSKKELEFIFILAIPCIMLFIYSLKEKNRKKYLYYYLAAFILALIGFAFSENRINEYTINGIYTRELNLIPFSSIKNYFLTPFGLKFGIYNILGNFLMLTPFAILLPRISNVFKKIHYYILLILGITISIELLQYAFNMGSFDIDDIILNFSGSFIFFFIFNKWKFFDNIINFIFIKWHNNKKYISIIYYIVAFITCLMSVMVVYNMIDEIRNKIPDLSYLACKNNMKTFITIDGNYKYYSNCDYGSGKTVFVGKMAYTLAEFLTMNNNYEKYKDRLNLYKEKIVTDVHVVENSSSIPRLMHTSHNKKESIYYIGIDTIMCKFDNKEEEYITLYTNKNNYFNIYTALLEAKKFERNEKDNYIFTVFESEYFINLNCSYDILKPDKVDSYFVSKDYNYDKAFCLDIKNNI